MVKKYRFGQNTLAQIKHTAHPVSPLFPYPFGSQHALRPIRPATLVFLVLALAGRGHAGSIA